MLQSIFIVETNEQIAKDIMKMTLSGDTSHITASGQFVNIKIEGLFLRRPISVCDVEGDVLTLIYKIIGEGTEKMAAMQKGTKLDILTGLGNGYNLSLSGDRPLLVGGGVGVPPMYYLCKLLVQMGKQPRVILGFNSEDDVFYEEEFKKLSDDVRIATADGSYGIKGFVTDAMDNLQYTHFFACGPEPMLKALSDNTETSGQLSFEERMGCGFGACMGCTCKTKYGNKRICKEGPVLIKEEIIW